MVNNGDWTYIRSIATGNVISARGDGADALRSQVYVRPPKETDEELWRWEGKYLKNKATGLVLDIRKGRLRLIEDTEICLYSMKPEEEARNQLWGMREDSVDALGRRLPGCVIYSVFHDDWVLDIQVNSVESEAKLILFPYQVIDNEYQRWSFVSDLHATTSTLPMTTTNSHLHHNNNSSNSNSNNNNYSNNNNHSNHAITSPAISPYAFASPTVDLSPSTSSSSLHDMPMDFVHGLTPAKRGSQSSMSGLALDTYKQAHQCVYVERSGPRSDKTVAMAAAYQTWQKWKTDQLNSQAMPTPDMMLNQRTRHEKTRAQLQLNARNEAIQLLEKSDFLKNQKEVTLSLTNRYITQLYEQMPSSP
ncbi:hypothetical protein EC973_007583 [Apophysomyces ossiformis]|uniref:Ricin B lectin domain-containing protein n=1 Tax=Apophysomyces ossiformis TaxID=679940 RepID=A0A8H7BUJ2_9FUNG|nr:hypothetical protein EC973_007583 [Apophysomyces ossiformis]